MLRRAADSAFWLGRYVERAEATARIVDVHFHSRLETANDESWESILAIAGLDDDFHARYDVADESSVLHFLAFDPDNPSSVLSCLKSARENARAIRGLISGEMWEAVNGWYLDLREWDVAQVERKSAFDFFRRVKRGSHLFHGAALRTQAKGDAREFLKAGGFVERADGTARILDVKASTLGADEEADLHGWTVVLQSVGAMEAYVRANRQGVSPEGVTRYLVLSPAFPASVLFSISNLEASLRSISGNRAPLPANEAERCAGRLYRDLLYLTVEEITERGMHEFVEDLQGRFAEIGDAVWETYLSY